MYICLLYKSELSYTISKIQIVVKMHTHIDSTYSN